MSEEAQQPNFDVVKAKREQVPDYGLRGEQPRRLSPVKSWPEREMNTIVQTMENMSLIIFK